MIKKRDEYMRHVTKIILSRRTALIIIALIGTLCFIGVNIPQTTDVSSSYYAQWQGNHKIIAPIVETLHFNKMYSSELFLGAIVFLLVALSYSIFGLYKSLKRNSLKENLDINARTFKNYFSFTALSTSSIDTVLDDAVKSGYTVYSLPENKFRFGKNSISKWGTLILHTGMLLVITAGLLTFLFEKRGFVQLLEGDTFFGSKGEFLTTSGGRLAGTFAPNVNIALNQLAPKYYSDGSLEALESSVAVGNGSESLQKVSLSINHPYEAEGVKIYQSPSFGYTVCLQLEKDGAMIPTYFSLEHPSKKGKPFVGYSDFPTTNYFCRMELYPDTKGGSFEINDPILMLTVEENGTIIYSGRLQQADHINLGKGTLTFMNVRHWSGLIFVENYSVPITFIGFTMILLGLILIYMFPLREIYMSVKHIEGDIQFSFGGFTRRERALFSEEFQRFVESIYIKEGKINVGSELVEI